MNGDDDDFEPSEYMHSCPELPPELLEKLALDGEPTPEEERRLRALIAEIDRRRARHEQQTGQLIVPEKTMLPHELPPEDP